MLITPFGNPASLTKWQTANALNGVFSDVLMITVHPDASAGEIFQASMSLQKTCEFQRPTIGNLRGTYNGKFHGMTAAQTPTGSRIV
jgi:hypothetical protein